MIAKSCKSVDTATDQIEIHSCKDCFGSHRSIPSIGIKILPFCLASRCSFLYFLLVPVVFMSYTSLPPANVFILRMMVPIVMRRVLWSFPG